MLFFRDCSVCKERVLSINKQTRKRKHPSLSASSSSSGSSLQELRSSLERSFTGLTASFPAEKNTGGSTYISTSTIEVCQCLSCGKYAHRECLSFVHAHRHCQNARCAELLPRCDHQTTSIYRHTTSIASDMKQSPARQQLPQLFGKPPSTTPSIPLSTLLEELSSSSFTSSSSATKAPSSSSSSKTPPTKASKIVRRIAPVLAAGGVIGAIALGPVGGALAGLNLFITSVGVEAVAAGIGLTAATAAAATVTHQQKIRAAKRKQEKLQAGEWAMEICWNCKKANQDTPSSDEAFRKDAELLRRFQRSLAIRYDIQHRDEQQGDYGEPSQDLLPPDADEVYGFLFSIFASPGELLSQINMQLCRAFRERYVARQKEHPTHRASTISSASISKDTLQDTKMYIAHILGATMQCFPSLASTEEAISRCTQGIERIVYDDIYTIVFGEFEAAFAQADLIFHDNLDAIRDEQRHRPITLLYRSDSRIDKPSNGEELGYADKNLIFDDDLLVAEDKLMMMIQVAHSPLQKLELLCDAFRQICCFADRLHQTASNADILIPIVCALLISSAKLAKIQRTFVSEIAFISFFTNGGGKGVEGYVLTTFQAVVQVIAAVDLSNGPAKELELYMHEARLEEGYDGEAETEDEEFFDALSHH